MDCVVLVPRRPKPWRNALWRNVRRQVEEELGWSIVEGASADGPFNRSAAVNQAAADAGAWDAAVILDADTVPDFDLVRQAVELAAGAGGLVLPHTEFRSLSRRATKAVLSGEVEPAQAPTRWTTRETKSSCLCLGRGLWQEVGGFDERFRGWGFEDAAFFAACSALAGVSRLEGPVHHLWHPRSAEKDTRSPQYQANRQLAARYKGARADCDAMRAILAEPGGPLA
jgi:hypothetical protein